MNAAQIYMASGAVNVTAVGLLSFLLVRTFKPIIDQWAGKPESPAHDAKINAVVLSLTIVLSFLAQWAGPVGLHTSTAAVALLFEIISSFLVAQGVYHVATTASAVSGVVRVIGSTFSNDMRPQVVSQDNPPAATEPPDVMRPISPPGPHP